MSGEWGGDVEFAAVPADRAVRSDALDQIGVWIPGRGEAGGVPSGRGRVQVGRWPVAEGLVWTVLVVLPSEVIEAELLRARRGGRGRRRVGLERAVHPLVAAGVLGMRWAATIRSDAQFDPPDRQRAQAGKPGRGERRAGVGPDRGWPAELAAGRLEARADPFPVEPRHDRGPQPGTAGRVGDGQRIAPGAVARLELPLEARWSDAPRAPPRSARSPPGRSSPGATVSGARDRSASPANPSGHGPAPPTWSPSFD